MKVCSKCGIEKPYEQFSKHKNTSDKLQGYCKQCSYNAVRKYVKENRTHWNKLGKGWREKNGIGVYGLWNKIENCWDYIGEGRLYDREKSHYSPHPRKTSTPFEVKLNVWFDGFDNVYEFRVLCKCNSKQQCKDMETKYINKLQPRYNKNKRQHKVEL